MSTQIINLWEKTLNIIKGELTEVSFNTWIKSITPVKIEDNTIFLCVPNDFTRGILNSRYKDLIGNALKIITSEKYQIEFFIASEEPPSLEKDKDETKL